MRLKLSEWIMIVAASCLLVFAGYFYFSNASLRQLLLGSTSHDLRDRVGTLKRKVGSVQRQSATSTGFIDLQIEDPVFSGDSVVTDPQGHATLMLHDGGIVEIAGGSMVLLELESQISLDGISRVANVEVIRGSVTGSAQERKIQLKSEGQTVTLEKNERRSIGKPRPSTASLPPAPEPEPTGPVGIPLPPSPEPLAPATSPDPTPTESGAPRNTVSSPQVKPSPTALRGIQMDAPSAGATVRPGEVRFSWKADPPNVVPLVFVLTRVFRSSEGDLEREELARRSLTDSSTTFRLSSGNYEWELRGSDGRPIKGLGARSEFRVRSSLEEVVIQPSRLGTPHAGGDPRDFEVRLSWEPPPKSSRCRVLVWDSPNSRARPIIQSATIQSFFRFNRKEIVSARAFFSVECDLPGSRQVKAGPHPVVLTFRPPEPQRPRRSGEQFQFSWKAAPFADRYEIEVSSDATFAKPLYREWVSARQALAKLKKGTYYWRVRASSGDQTSEWSSKQTLSVP